MSCRIPFQKGNSGAIARHRLELVLISDETQVNSGVIDLIRSDLIDVISRYADFDSAKVTIRLSRSGENAALAAEIPICQFTDLRNE